MRPRFDAVDWASRRRVPYDVTLNGIAFTIEVPDGLPRNRYAAGDWTDDRSEYNELPKVVTATIEAFRLESLASAELRTTIYARDKTWVRREERDDGWGLTAADPDGRRIDAITYRRAAALYVRCRATRQTREPMPDREAMRAALEAICDSIAIKRPSGSRRL